MPKKRKKNKLFEKDKAEKKLVQIIENASQGLYYISETDAEITPFIGTKTDSVSKEEILRQTKNAAEATIEERSFDEIFQRLTKIEDWFGDEEKATAAKFTALRDVLKNNLKDLKVFKIGSIQIDIYCVGLDANGILTGIKTRAVET